MAADLDIQTPGGRLRARDHRIGGEGLVIGIPGLTANLVSFEALAEAVPMVVLDLRGRGMSDISGPGTYGWESHARDVIEVANQLAGPEGRFSLVGWSMGAFVALAAARLAGPRIDDVALIDALGPVSPEVVNLIRMSVSRLGTVYPSLDDYLQLVRSTGLIDPWGEIWERYFAYELKPVEGGPPPEPGSAGQAVGGGPPTVIGVTARTDRAAVEEDIAYGEAVTDPEPYWRALTMPSLVVRAARPLLPGTQAYVLEPSVVERFCALVPMAGVVEVDANHYGVGAHPDTLTAVRDFLSSR